MTTADFAQAGDIVRFWREIGRKAWFTKDAAVDDAIRRRFEATHHAAAGGELVGWGGAAESALALILLLDQVPRNLWRGSPHAFATDPLARLAARDAIERGHDRSTPLDLRLFFYLPFSHAEDPADQALAVMLTEALEREGGESARSAREHQAIILRFGRFPHRNAALGRDPTREERRFLEAGGFAG
jgi:uncharacterized protein (DUF924 family)